MNSDSLIDNGTERAQMKESDDLASIIAEEEEELEDLEEEFSFCSLAVDQDSTIAADDIFEDGRIRPLLPLFGRDVHSDGELTVAKLPSLKVFVEKEEAEGPCCEWDGKSPRRPEVVVDASPGRCKKSNSTGFSKLLKFRELMIRSNSDGKDAFIFLSPRNSSSKPRNGLGDGDGGDSKKKIAGGAITKKLMDKETTPFSAHYERNRASKEFNKRVSYLPYRVGFFADVNGLSKNVHPF